MTEKEKPIVDAEVVEPGTEIVASDTPAAVAETGSMISMIERVALNPDVDVETLERMLAMQEKVLNRQAEQGGLFGKEEIDSIIPAIKKDRENKQTNSTYANLDSLNKVIKPLYTKEGFSLSFGTDGEVLPNTVRITCIVSHIGGHSRNYTYDAPIDDKGIKGSVNKTPTHARGSAVTYGQRYLTKMIFNLTLTDEDDDGNSADTSPTELLSDNQVRELEGIIDENGIDKAAFLKWAKVVTLGEIEAAGFESAKAALLKSVAA